MSSASYEPDRDGAIRRAFDEKDDPPLSSAASSSGREVSGEGPMISRPDSPAAQSHTDSTDLHTCGDSASAARRREYRRRLVRSALIHPHIVVYRAARWCRWKSWRTLRWPLFFVSNPSPLSPEAQRGLQIKVAEMLRREADDAAK